MNPIIPDLPVECPHCGATMRLVTPRGQADYEPFWGCTEFANSKCKGTRQISMTTMLPVYTQEEEDFETLKWIQEEVYPDPGAEI